MVDRVSKKAAWGVVFLLIAFAVFYIFLKSSWLQKKIYPIRYDDYIMKYAGEYQVDPHLVMAIIWVESKYDKDAKSTRDARGLMQVMPRTGQWAAETIGLQSYHKDLLYNPETNIQIGCWYLNNLNEQFHEDIDLVLAAYNGGSGNVAKWLRDKRYSSDGKTLHNIPFKETKDYVGKVRSIYKIYKKLYDL